MAGRPVGWFQVCVRDMAQATASWASMLGVHLNGLPNTDVDLTAFPGDMSSCGAGGAPVAMEGMPSGGSGKPVCFRRPDRGPVARCAAASGGTFVRGKRSIGDYGFIALRTDTAGNTSALPSMA